MFCIFHDLIRAFSLTSPIKINVITALKQKQTNFAFQGRLYLQ